MLDFSFKKTLSLLLILILLVLRSKTNNIKIVKIYIYIYMLYICYIYNKYLSTACQKDENHLIWRQKLQKSFILTKTTKLSD